ncbi:hypothetical protein PAMP_019623 [Pampus punctatissimus]
MREALKEKEIELRYQDSILKYQSDEFTLIGVDTSMYQALRSMVRRLACAPRADRILTASSQYIGNIMQAIGAQQSQYGLYMVNCSQIINLPTLSFVISGVSLPLPPSAYIIQQYQNGYHYSAQWESPPPTCPLVMASLCGSMETCSSETLTCSQEERGNGKWIGKTSQPCPPSSSTNDSERLQKITEGAQSIQNHRTEDGRNRGQRFFLATAPQMPPGRKPSIRRACSAPSNLQSTIQTSRVGGGVRA